MGFYKSLRLILRSSAFLYNSKQAFSKGVQSFFLPEEVLLYRKINTNFTFKKYDVISQVHTSRNFSKKYTAEEIQKLADCILLENPTCNELKKEEMAKILDFLISHGYKLSDIKKKGLNFLISSNTSYIKIQQIAELGPNILELMPFINLSLQSLRKAALLAKEDKLEIVGFPNRILYLSHHLETPVEEIILALTKHASLLTMPFSKLNRKMNFLKNAAISPEDLVKDLWIFNYNERLLTSRISAAEQAGVKLKPWMLRCSDKFFTSRLNKETQTNRILKGNDVVQYLSQKLECNEDYIKHMMEKNKLLRKVNIPKIEQIINFLYEKGYTPQEVRLLPRVFSTKIETLDKRFQEGKKLLRTLPPISHLSVGSKFYKNIIEKRQKTN